MENEELHRQLIAEALELLARMTDEQILEVLRQMNDE